MTTNTQEILTEQQVMDLGWVGESIEQVLEVQSQLTEYETSLVTNISTDDEHLGEWLEDNQQLAYVVTDFDIETYMVWIEGCEYGINLGECDVVGTDFDTDEMGKALALLDAINEDLSEINNLEISSYDNNIFELGSSEYLVVDEEERDEAMKDECENQAWAFSSSFLAELTDWDLQTVFETMQKAGLCESANEAVLCLVEKYSSLEEMVELAVSYDGYGHFLARYDGHELESGEYFIYRNN